MQTQRRAIAAALVAFPALWRGVRAQAAQHLQATPSQTEGPFYPVRMPADADHDLLRNGALRYTGGQPTWLHGQLQDLAGKPLPGAQVEIWQCDADGHYDHPGDGARQHPAFQGFGRTTVAADGSWRFRTIKPMPYPGRTPHIHVKVWLGGREALTTQLYVAGDPGNARDGIWRRLQAAERDAVTLDFRPGADGLQAHCRLVLAT